MEFTKIHSDIEVVCVGSENIENTTDIFIRRIKKESLEESDFLSYWELGRRPDSLDKESVCSYKAVSVYKHNDDASVEAKILSLFSKARSFKPSLSPIYCKLRFKTGAGKIKIDGNCQPYHCSFFKEDKFSLSLIEVAEVKRCENV